MIVIAHRGASAYAPEHTLAAYDLAVSMGADYIEQDLQMTADGELVVLHDATLDRTTRGDPALCTGPVVERTFEQVRTCDAGTWFNERHPDHARAEFAEQRVPTLGDVLERYVGRAHFYIETKNPAEAPGMEEKLVSLLERHALRSSGGSRQATEAGAHSAWSPLPQVVVQSFSEASLRKVHALAQELPLVQLFGSEVTGDGVIAALDRVIEYAAGIGPHRVAVDRRLVAVARARGLVVHPYTVNDEPEMSRLIALGADGMFTDTPDRLRRLLEAR